MRYAPAHKPLQLFSVDSACIVPARGTQGLPSHSARLEQVTGHDAAEAPSHHLHATVRCWPQLIEGRWKVSLIALLQDIHAIHIDAKSMLQVQASKIPRSHLMLSGNSAV